MQLVMFAKHMRSLDMAQAAASAARWGLDGLDYPVRAGYAVNPDNFRTALPELVRALRREGLSLPMLTAEGNLTDPLGTSYVEPLLGTMMENDVRLLKIGYFPFREEVGYWPSVSDAREALARWEKVARRYAVTVVYHTHSGPYIGLNASSLMHVVRDFDPSCVGAYLDTGHLTISGEEFPMACSIVGEYLKVVALKDMARVKDTADGRTVFVRKVFRPGEGATDLRGALRCLVARGFAGPLTIHMEWSRDDDELLAGSGEDAATYRRWLDEAAGSVQATGV